MVIIELHRRIYTEYNIMIQSSTAIQGTLTSLWRVIYVNVTRFHTEITDALSAAYLSRQIKTTDNVHCLKKRPTFTTCYNFYIHSFIATIFGTNVAEKVGNQSLLYFPTTHTTPNLCFCNTLGNRKPGNCVFSLKCCMLFHQKNTNHS